MAGYILLGASALFSLFGFGIFAMVVLVVAIVRAGRTRDQVLTDSLTIVHAEYVRRSAMQAIMIHLAVTVFLAYEMALAIQGGQAGGIMQAFLIHYIIDHAAEFVIGAWTAYRAIRGGLNLGDQLGPNGVSLALGHNLATRTDTSNSASS